VAIREKSKNQLRIKNALEIAGQREVEWVEVNAGKLDKRIFDTTSY